MTAAVIAGGRTITSELLVELEVIANSGSFADLSELSRWLCARLGWRNPQGEPCVTSATKALRGLERKGRLRLPWAARPRGELRPVETQLLEELQTDVAGRVDQHRVELFLIEPGGSKEAQLWKAMIAKYHDLGDRPLFGAQLRYLVSCSNQWIGALGFAASAFQVAARDKYIGWSTVARKAHLQEVVSNSRFLIRPRVRIENLGSHVLTMATKRLGKDWQNRYGYRPLLVETFVAEHRRGSSYRAAGWKEVGMTSGRGRQDTRRERAATPKRIFLQPLAPGWQRRLCREPPLKHRVSCTQLPTGAKSDAQWVEQELGDAPLGDVRLVNRLVALAKDFWGQPQGSVLQTCDSIRAKIKAAYRFLNNKVVTMEKILTPHYGSTVQRISEWGAQQQSSENSGATRKPIVLAVQDTTTITYRDRPQTKGLGYINNPKDNARGFLVHDTLVLTPAGLPLGLLDVQSWARDDEQYGKKAERASKPIEEKESNKWLLSYEAVA